MGALEEFEYHRNKIANLVELFQVRALYWHCLCDLGDAIKKCVERGLEETHARTFLLPNPKGFQGLNGMSITEEEAIYILAQRKGK